MSFEYFNQKFIELEKDLRDQKLCMERERTRSDGMMVRLDILDGAVGNLKHYSRKELIDKLEKFKDTIIDKLGELDERIESLEDDECCDEDITCTQGMQDFLDTLKSRKSLEGLIAKEGTFEWALIQMKYGRVVKQKSKESRQFMKFDKFYGENPNGVLMSQWNFQEWSSSSILANDWEIVE